MTLAAKQIIDRLKNAPGITDVRHINDTRDTIHYTTAGKQYRVEHFTNFPKHRVELHLYGSTGILHIAETVEDMLDFILI